MRIAFWIVLAIAMLQACQPKSGGKMTTTPVKTTATAPKIPLPTGDVRAQAPQPGTPPTLQIGKAHTFALPNGLQCIVVENHKLPKVSIRIFVDYDPVLEGNAAGCLDQMGMLLTAGTTTRTKNQIDEEVDFMGASLRSDRNGISGSCLTRHAEKLLALIADAVQRPNFPAEELEKNKNKTLTALAQSKDNAEVIANNVSSVLNFTDTHPFGEVVTEASVEKIDLAAIKKHYQTYFKPNIAYLVITGDIQPKVAENLAKKYFGSWQRGDVPKNKYAHPAPPEKAKVVFVHKPGAVQSVINITHPVVLEPADGDVIAARLMNTVLGGYFNSRVNDNLREKRAYTYGARTSLTPNEVCGDFKAFASVRNAVTDSAIQQFIFELSRLRDVKMPEKELQLVKNVLTGSFSRSLEEPATVANFALNQARFKLPPDYYEKYIERLNNVTAEDIQRMARKYVLPANAYILVVGNRDEVAEKLRKFSPEGKILFLDAFGKPERPTVKIPDGMTAEKILQDYTQAIGGMANIQKIKDLRIEANMSAGGPVLKSVEVTKMPDKHFSDVLMNGQSMSKTIVNGNKALEISMGNQVQKLEGTRLTLALENATLFKGAFYLQKGYKANLLGVENIDEKIAYEIEVTRPDGSKFKEYYDMATSLKIREVVTVTEGSQTVTLVNDFLDYRTVEGVQLPHTTLLGGIFPTPLKVTVTQIKINAGADDALFRVD